MADKVHSLTIVLKDDISEDRATNLAQILMHLDGVLHVKGNVTDPAALVARDRAFREIESRLWEALHRSIGGHT